jgi:hypothetical protein
MIYDATRDWLQLVAQQHLISIQTYMLSMLDGGRKMEDSGIRPPSFVFRPIRMSDV